MQESEFPNPPPRLLRFGEIIDASFKLYFKHFGHFVLLLAVVELPYQVISDLVSATTRSSSQQTAGGANLVAFHVSNVSSWSLLPLLLLLLVVAPLSAGAISWAVAKAYCGSPTSIAASYRVARQHWGRMILLSLAYLALGIGVMVIGVIANVVVAVVFRLVLGKAGLLIEIVAIPATLVLIWILFLRLVVSTPALVLENLFPMGAMGRSWQLTHRGVWRTLGVLLVLALVAGIAELLGIGIASAIAGVLGGGNGLTSDLRLVAESLVGLVVGPLTWIGTVILYFDFRTRSAEPLAPTVPPLTPPEPMPQPF